MLGSRPEEISEKLNIDINTVIEALESHDFMLSFDYKDTGHEIVPERLDFTADVDEKLIVETFLNELRPRHREIMELYLSEVSGADIAHKLGISRTRVWSI